LGSKDYFELGGGAANDLICCFVLERPRHVEHFDFVTVGIVQRNGRIGRASTSGRSRRLLLLRHGSSKGNVVRGRRNRRAENDVHETWQVVFFVTAVVVVAAVTKVSGAALKEQATKARVITQGGQETFKGDRGFRLLIFLVHLEFLASVLDLGETSLAEGTRVFSATPCFDTVKTKLVVAAINGGRTIAFRNANGARCGFFVARLAFLFA